MFQVHRHDAVDSTQSEAARRVRAGLARHGEVHVARRQTAGRGRQGRRWHSAPGEGLYATLVWFAAARPAGTAVTMAAGLAVLEAVRALGLAGARLDWPNDVEVDGEKLAGVLIDALPTDGRVALVVGVGVNAAQRSFPPELLAERGVTSLALHGIEADPADLLEALLPRLAARLDQAAGPDPDGAGAAALARDYALATGLVGAPVVARVAAASGGEAEVRGTLTALGLDGLELTTPSGPRRLALERVRALDRDGPGPGR